MITEYCRNFTPEQMNFWRECNGQIAWNTIVPLYFHGTLAGSEFTVFNVAKFYMALELDFSWATIAGVGAENVELFNMANAQKEQYLNLYPVWNTTAAAIYYMGLDFFLKNVWFSRVANAGGGYHHIKFNGFRLNII
jgi:hypothetical protein